MVKGIWSLNYLTNASFISPPPYQLRQVCHWAKLQPSWSLYHGLWQWTCNWAAEGASGFLMRKSVIKDHTLGTKLFPHLSRRVSSQHYPGSTFWASCPFCNKYNKVYKIVSTPTPWINKSISIETYNINFCSKPLVYRYAQEMIVHHHQGRTTHPEDTAYLPNLGASATQVTSDVCPIPEARSLGGGVRQKKSIKIIGVNRIFWNSKQKK